MKIKDVEPGNIFVLLSDTNVQYNKTIKKGIPLLKLKFDESNYYLACKLDDFGYNFFSGLQGEKIDCKIIGKLPTVNTITENITL